MLRSWPPSSSSASQRTGCQLRQHWTMNTSATFLHGSGSCRTVRNTSSLPAVSQPFATMFWNTVLIETAEILPTPKEKPVQGSLLTLCPFQCRLLTKEIKSANKLLFGCMKAEEVWIKSKDEPFEGKKIDSEILGDYCAFKWCVNTVAILFMGNVYAGRGLCSVKTSSWISSSHDCPWLSSNFILWKKSKTGYETDTETWDESFKFEETRFSFFHPT